MSAMEPAEIEQLAAAMEPLLGVPIDPQWRPRIVAFLAMAESAARLYRDLPLDEARDEAAPVFQPGRGAPLP